MRQSTELNMNRREFLKNMTLGAVALAAGVPVISGEPKQEVVLAKRLPVWKGFNLLEMFSGGRPRPFRESDFEIMAQWGFNFVRIPMSYWNWSRPERWLEINETIFQYVDEVVELGRQYGVHICLNLHRIPGYCVNGNEREPHHLFDGPPEERRAALDAAQTHWRFIAKRYRDVPTRRLSFNLLNEPRDMPATDYLPVVTALVEAIRAVNPDRLIIADGLAWGTKPVPELAPLGIAQSTRGYEPMLISHYRASWINGSDTWPEPAWPVPVSMNQHLYGDNKPELKSPLVLRVENPQATQLSIRIGHVSGTAELLIGADGTAVLQKQFTPGPGEGDWKTSVPDQWGGYQADYDRVYTASIPAGTREISVEVGKGDWLTFTEIRLSPYLGAPTGEAVIKPIDQMWGVRQEAFMLDAAGRGRLVNPRFLHTRETLRVRMIEPWQRLAAQGVGVHVGEWGAHNQTPHTVVLGWMRDCLTNWKQVGWGWALWNLRGSFGVLDSERADVRYEPFRGHQLDRRMLELLREFVA